jgi:hypothetical protein
MVLHIDKNMTLGDVQAAFSHLFPFLKIGFFLDRNKDNSLSADEQIHNPKMTVASIRDIDFDGDLQIEATMTAKQLESAFWNTFGLDVQLFRRSGNTWLVTQNTDDWTLIQHNEKAREMNTPVENPETPDYTEQE